MYQYEFVRIELKQRLFKKVPREDYQEIIRSYAQRGWRFKQIFAPSIKSHGIAAYYELIFEKEL